MHISPQIKTFFLGLSVSILILVAFFAGAIADRVFVIKPLDLLSSRNGLQKVVQEVSNTDSTVTVTSGSSSIPQVVKNSSDSVVTVSITAERTVVETESGDLFGLSSFLNITDERVELVKQDIGTGFVIEGGFIVTNRHVVSELDGEYSVVDRYEREFPVSRVYRDPSNDLAILKIEEGVLPALPLGDSDALAAGEQVIAIGTALGEFRHTVTAGIISGLGRGIVAREGLDIQALDGVIQTDAAINPGNSGGPLLNASGQVIGVNVARSSVGEGIGFALPINVVTASVENFNKTGQFDRPFFGVRYRMISETAAEFNQVPVGAYVSEVLANGSAATIDLQEGDIIVELAGDKITENTNLGELINDTKIGEVIDITYWRNGQVIRGQVTLLGG
jgi:S1-C subfamily serine protease